MIVQEDPYASIYLIRERLIKLGYTVDEIILDEKYYYRFTAPNGRSWTVLAHQIGYPFPTLSASSLSRSKARANQLAELASVPTPDTVVVERGSSTDEAQKLLNIHDSLIVKPLDSSLARGLTLDIQDDIALENALLRAYEYSETALVQEQVFGEEIRFAVIGGKVRAALLRRTARVVGDGVLTVAELIQRENESRSQLDMPYVAYPQLDEAIINIRHLSDQTVLSAGEIRELSRGTMIKTGASIYNVLDEVHPSYIDDIERLAGMLGYGFVVVDMFMSEFTEPQRSGNHWFIEFNTSPVLKLFYSCRDGKMYDVLSDLVPMIDQAVGGTSRKP